MGNISINFLLGGEGFTSKDHDFCLFCYFDPWNPHESSEVHIPKVSGFELLGVQSFFFYTKIHGECHTVSDYFTKGSCPKDPDPSSE